MCKFNSHHDTQLQLDRASSKLPAAYGASQVAARGEEGHANGTLPHQGSTPTCSNARSVLQVQIMARRYCQGDDERAPARDVRSEYGRPAGLVIIERPAEKTVNIAPST